MHPKSIVNEMNKNHKKLEFSKLLDTYASWAKVDTPCPIWCYDTPLSRFFAKYEYIDYKQNGNIV